MLNQTDTMKLSRDVVGEATITASAFAILAAASLEPTNVQGRHHVILPPGYKREDITDLVEKSQPTPQRKTGTVVLKDLASFLLYCQQQATANGSDKTGLIYCDSDVFKFTAVFNDHRDAEAGWRDFRAEFKAQYTPEFSKWLNANGKQMGQTEFAEFIEDNFADITEPAAQSLLDVATTIQAKTDINFSSAKRLDNGQVQLGYTETIDARAGANGALQIPKVFSLGLRIFKNGTGYKLNARLKYRLSNGSVKFWYELDRPERSVEDAFAGYIEQARAASGYTVLLGAA